MGSKPVHPPVIHYDNAVRVHHTGHTLGNDQLRGVGNLLRESLSDLRVRGRIHRAGGVIQNQHFRFLEKGPRYGKPLPLPAGNICAALFYIRVIPLRHLLDKFIRTGEPAYPPALLLRGIRITPTQVIQNRA